MVKRRFKGRGGTKEPCDTGGSCLLLPEQRGNRGRGLGSKKGLDPRSEGVKKKLHRKQRYAKLCLCTSTVALPGFSLGNPKMPVPKDGGGAERPRPEEELVAGTSSIYWN